MKLYNTLTRKKEEFKPLKADEVTIYTCGPTVYDQVHIGNLRAFIFADILRRVVRSSGFKLKAVMNITDVDDKTIHRSLEEHKDLDPMMALKQLTLKYEKRFLDDCLRVGIDMHAVKQVRATDQIELMCTLIQRIHESGFAYVATDGVYFDVSKYSQDHPYGVLSKIEISRSHSRINNDEYDKTEARDFALWKVSDPGEPSWDLVIKGKTISGRPGWHIECSAMSTALLSQPFDIHTGGIDLVFPHHENEIAQSKAATGQELATVFVHNEHLLVDGKKMSKSLKNFYTLEDIKAKGFDPLAFRLLIMMSHYRTQQNFTWQALEGATNLLRTIRTWSDLRFQYFKSDKLTKNYKEAISVFKRELFDDLSTPTALAFLNGMISRVDELGVDSGAVAQAVQLFDRTLGLKLTDRTDITTEQNNLIKERQEARDKKDFKKSDEIRDQLLNAGVGLLDTPDGTRWHRV